MEVLLSPQLWRCVRAAATPCVQKGPVLLLVSVVGSHVDAEVLKSLKVACLTTLSWGALEANMWWVTLCCLSGAGSVSPLLCAVVSGDGISCVHLVWTPCSFQGGDAWVWAGAVLRPQYLPSCIPRKGCFMLFPRITPTAVDFFSFLKRLRMQWENVDN